MCEIDSYVVNISYILMLTVKQSLGARQLSDTWYKVPDLVSLQGAKLKEKEEGERYLRVHKKEKYSFRARK